MKTIPLHRARNLIKQYQALTGKPLKDINQQGLKIALEWLAERTPPIGKGKAAQGAGQTLIAHDVATLFPRNPFPVIQRRKGRDMAERFWALWQDFLKGDASARPELERIFRESGMEFVNASEMPRRHAAARGGRRNRPSVRTRYILPTDQRRDVDAFTAKLQKLVGYSKGGWAAAARQLGTSRLPAWMAGPGDSFLIQGPQGVKAKGINRVEFIDRLITSQQLAMAESIGKQRVMKMMQKAVAAAEAKA